MLENFIFLTISFLCLITLVVQRIFFDRLSSYPGPLLASFTGWYRAYYDVIKFGGLVEHVKALHDKYGTSANSEHAYFRTRPSLIHPGPVVRIGLNEVR